MKLPAKALKWKDNVYGHHWICTARPTRATWYTSNKQAVSNNQGMSGHMNTDGTFEDPLTQSPTPYTNPEGQLHTARSVHLHRTWGITQTRKTPADPAGLQVEVKQLKDALSTHNTHSISWEVAGELPTWHHLRCRTEAKGQKTRNTLVTGQINKASLITRSWTRTKWSWKEVSRELEETNGWNCQPINVLVALSVTD